MRSVLACLVPVGRVTVCAPHMEAIRQLYSKMNVLKPPPYATSHKAVS